MLICFQCASLIFANSTFIEKTEEPADQENLTYQIVRSTECNEDLCKGMIFLIEKNPEAALDALDLATVHNQQNPVQNEFNAIISFCQAIAYDQLGARILSTQALDSLNNALIDENEPEDNQEPVSIDVETQKASEFLHRLATLAPSSDIEQSLHLIVDQISGEIPFLFGSECCCADGVNSTNHSGYSKFIKRWTHILKRVGQLFELIKNIELIIENGKELIKK